MFTDIAGYTQMTEENETLAMQLLEEHREIIRSILPSHGGREVKTIGDAFLVEFDSALAAVRCSVDIQKALFARNKSVSEERRIHVRIGVHVGDVEHRQGDIYGDAVNVASRIQSLAVPGGVTLSQQVHDLVRNKVGHPLVKLKRRELKNLATPIDLYSLSLKPEPG
jgi:class 3 adenylate cyclase